jgi:hypothetical protein
MNRQPVASSNVESVGYDDDSSTLEVAFHSGSVYQYFDVPRAVYDTLLQAESPGSFLHEQIRGVFRYART